MGRCGVLIVPALGVFFLGACAGLPQDVESKATVDSLRVPAPTPNPLVVELPLPEPPVLDDMPELHQIHRPEVSAVDSVLPEPRIVSKGTLSARSAAQQLERWGGPLTGWIPKPATPPLVSDPEPVRPAPENLTTRSSSAPTPRTAATTPAAPRVKPVRPVPAVADTAEPSPSAAGVETAFEEVFVKSGDAIQISLSGNGWILIGPPEVGVAEFRSREQLAGRTVFEFRGIAPGKTALEFIRQNHAEGIREQQQFQLAVLSETELNARFNSVRTPELAPLDRTHIDQLLSLGRYEEARAELERTYRPDSSFHNETLARIGQVLGQSETARTYWGRNLPPEGLQGPSTPYEESALIGTMDLALQGRDLLLVLKTLAGVMAVRSLDTSEVLLETASYLVESNRVSSALEALEVHQRRYPNTVDADRFFFVLAQVFEANSEIRDLKRSKDYYQTVYTGYPESPLADAARKRARFLDRHFLKIQ